MPIEPNFAGDYPVVSSRAYVHSTAIVIGKVFLADGVFVGPRAVVRADEPGPDGTVEPVVVGPCSNVQDGVVIHALRGTGVEIGPRSSIAHAAVVHGPCKIGKNCFVGFNSVVFRATLGDGVVVMHQALVEGVTVPGGVLVPSLTAARSIADVQKLTPVPPDLIEFARSVIETNVAMASDGLMRNASGKRHEG
jgi:carbonic anhydrase/acetyltransferase-like protein (isoleucine patch superfamily)